MRHTFFATVVALLFVGSLRAAAPFVWIESETPAKTTVAGTAEAFAGGKWLSAGRWMRFSFKPEQATEQIPREGAIFEYPFTIAAGGKHEVWNRIGMEFIRTAFDWRIDAGVWQTITPEMLTTDLMELSLWTEVAWIKMGDVELPAGAHTLQIRVKQGTRQEKVKQKDAGGKVVEVAAVVPDKVLYVSDCVCISAGRFYPNAQHQPGADWQTAEDKAATTTVFDVKPGVNPAERVETSLKGLWQVCRYDELEVVDRTGPTKELPPAEAAFWKSTNVPGNKFKDRPDLAFAHRLVYRTRINVPAEMAGRSFYLKFPSINLIASVIVNGQFCGWTRAPYTLWECDTTSAIKAGQANEICVVIKDSYYAFSEQRTGKNARFSFNTPIERIAENYVTQNFDFPIGSGYAASAGIIEEPTFVAAGKVYTSDVFAKPDVKEKKLGLEITLVNPTAVEISAQVVNEIVPAAGAGGAAEKTFAPMAAKIPAGGQQVVQTSEGWANPKLWWPDEPNLYNMVTKVMVDGKVLDVRRTRFGFRQWEWNGTAFKLNGVPWLMFADTSMGHLGGSRKSAEEAIATWRKNGQNMWRAWGRSFGGMTASQTLDFTDEQGMPVRRSGIFDGQQANYLGGLAETVTIDGKQVRRGHKALFDNWILQMTAQVREERNHPAIFIWSLENEITFINSRNLNQKEVAEPEIARCGREVMAIDPTRPVMVDGGNCLMDKSLPVNGAHYIESPWREYPDEAYTLARAYATEGVGRSPWPLVADRPIFMGESYFLRGNNPASFAQFGGEECFGGWGPGTRKGAGLLAKMLAEGYRWHGVAATHFWLGGEDASMHYNSWQPVCVLAREWNWTFAGAQEIARTLKIFNGTRHADPIEARWDLTIDGKSASAGSKICNIAPGGDEELKITFKTPSVAGRATGALVLTCLRGGKEVFRETKVVALISPDGGRAEVAMDQLVVLDPFGSVKKRLTAKGVAFTAIEKPEDVPAGAKIIVIGKDAVTLRNATEPRWLALAARGARVLVLDQTYPLHYMAVPADLSPTDVAGRVAFMENAQHPIFQGLDQQDFFTWSGDHIVYRNVYRKATSGASSLAHCDDELSCSAVAQCNVEDGLMMLCQLVVGEKLDADPVAQRLFDNMLAYCASYKPLRRPTAVVMGTGTPRAKLLAESGLKYDAVASPLAAIQGGKHEVIVFDATPQSLAELAGALPQVQAFTGKGGWLMVWGLTPEGLASFNRLVGVEHLIRPFEREKVTLTSMRDPLGAGLTNRDIAMESAEKIFAWAGGRYMVNDEFTWIVDGEDIAPFCEIPGAKAGDLTTATAKGADWPRNIVNNFTTVEAWKLTHYMSGDNPRITLTLPRQEKIVEFSIVPNADYRMPAKVNLYFDDDKTPIALAAKRENERQDFSIEPRQASKVTVELADLTDMPGKPTGIDNLWIRVERDAAWKAKVKPLLNIGGLVNYPQGNGGIMLCQLNVPEREAVPDNAQKKKAIVNTLLRNVGATFAGAKIILPGEGMAYVPIALDEKCNQYLTLDRGWFDGKRDMKQLPVGQSTFGGVPYLVRDFRTSPLPACVMLAGSGVKGKMPAEVTDLPVGKKGDVLFFLHSFKRTRDWKKPDRGDAEPPVLFQYVIHYADGSEAVAAVRYDEGASHWLQRSPRGLKSATVAWAAAFPDDPEGEQAVAYQFQWNNPKPEMEIKSIDLKYDPASKGQYGVPAMLAMTAGTRLQK